MSWNILSKLKVGVAALAIGAMASTSAKAVEIEVFSTDFSSIPSELVIGAWDHVAEPVSGDTYPFVALSSISGSTSGMVLNTNTGGTHTATLSLTNLPAHDSVNIELVLGTGGGLDGGGDLFRMELDGNSI